ncbi:unnamed protein product [Polarella glacialis]|uniref:Uncharacterized protein n=1 Tax=Polarella glacialis TaxID=89957 RepID=A0A813F2R6_POLGL|nr:unnamed protein product [Polarella glacialis]CAE8719228.1 unnamed protein product [Polarella glacialis]
MQPGKPTVLNSSAVVLHTKSAGVSEPCIECLKMPARAASCRPAVALTTDPNTTAAAAETAQQLPAKNKANNENNNNQNDNNNSNNNNNNNNPQFTNKQTSKQTNRQLQMRKL